MLTQARLKELLSLDESTGKFTWNPGYTNGWATKKGREAGYYSSGYRRIKLDKVAYLAHRLVWLWYHGEFPKNRIDHKDENKLNNVISNLRVANNSQNIMNVGIKSNNTSGIKGVFWNKFHQKWWATITCNSKNYHIGYFVDKEEAAAAVRAKREELHGEFANHG